MIFCDERSALVDLIFGRLPIHIEDLVPGTNELVGLAMTIQAPFHVESFGFPHERHFIDRPVTNCATDSLGDVDAVIEENKIGNFIRAIPSERNAGCQALTNGSEQWSVCKQLGVTGHASAGIGNAGERGFFNRRVAVATVDSQLVRVMPMAEGNWLVKRCFRARGVGRPKDCIPCPACEGDGESNSQQAGTSNRVTSRMKDVRHRPFSTEGPGHVPCKMQEAQIERTAPSRLRAKVRPPIRLSSCRITNFPVPILIRQLRRWSARGSCQSMCQSPHATHRTRRSDRN